MKHQWEQNLASVVAAASKGRSEINQDSCGVYQGKRCSAAAIADGVGSSLHSEVAAELAVSSFLRAIQKWDARGDHDLHQSDVEGFWAESEKAITSYYAENSEACSSSSPLQTTLITLVDTPSAYILTCLGNGSACLLRGDFWEFVGRRWPWPISDLMIGDTSLDENGKESLYGVLTHKGLSSPPRWSMLSKDPRCGEIFVLTTDGVSSSDHLRVGQDPKGILWSEINPHVQVLVNTHIPGFLEGYPAININELLLHVLEKFLATAQFDDDATIAVLVSGAAMKYHTAKRTVEGA